MSQDNVKYGLISMFKRLTFYLIVLLIFGACQADENDLNGLVGLKAPAFTLTSLNENQVDLFDFKGKVVVLYFFGNNCPYCKAEASNIEDSLVSPYADRSDYVILGLDYWNGSPDLVQAFQKATGVTFPLLLDAGDVASNYKTTYNRIVIIDKNQNIVFSGTQSASKDVSAVKQKLKLLLVN